jgi:periplasmic protein CpxP/Spy
MKKTLFMACALLALLLTVNAQPPEPPKAEEMARRETDRMKTELSLTDAQVVVVDSINLKYAKKMTEMFKQGRENGGDFEAMRTKMDEVRVAKREELKTVLTEDQLKAYDKSEAEHMGHGPQGPPPLQ